MRGLLEKLLPLDRMLALATKFGLLRKPLELLAGVYRRAQGIKTQVLLAASATLVAADLLGLVPPEAKDSIRAIELVLLGAAKATFAEKASRVLEQADRVAAAVKEAADKQKAEEAKNVGQQGGPPALQ